MIAIDTNVLVRILTDDKKNSEQCDSARNLASYHRQLYIPQIVQAECVWVLESAYKLDKSEIIKILEHLDSNKAFILQNADRFHTALENYRNNNADFSDFLILAESNKINIELYSYQFDRT